MDVAEKLAKGMADPHERIKVLNQVDVVRSALAAYADGSVDTKKQAGAATEAPISLLLSARLIHVPPTFNAPTSPPPLAQASAQSVNTHIPQCRTPHRTTIPPPTPPNPPSSPPKPPHALNNLHPAYTPQTPSCAPQSQQCRTTPSAQPTSRTPKHTLAVSRLPENVLHALARGSPRRRRLRCAWNRELVHVDVSGSVTWTIEQAEEFVRTMNAIRDGIGEEIPEVLGDGVGLLDDGIGAQVNGGEEPIAEGFSQPLVLRGARPGHDGA
ncbi:unnamed protein product [Zymoseptoria tritici ST99CH_1A5]|uniref:Uncharacterized protein n=1 Tax=Zymoseptoria tritici ST99CH_1A5 TaxID=1276529 RepID=A0A1Y6LIV9_ZYMTR|nr:unnamed protein product [Zymoseptoria tritici ST99CH_1A5]